MKKENCPISFFDCIFMCLELRLINVCRQASEHSINSSGLYIYFSSAETITNIDFFFIFVKPRSRCMVCVCAYEKEKAH